MFKSILISILAVLMMISFSTKAQMNINQTEQKIKQLLIETIPANIDSLKTKNSEYYIIDIRFDKTRSKVRAIEIICENNQTRTFQYLQKLTAQVRTFQLAANNYDRLLIPISILPLCDNCSMDDYPILTESCQKSFKDGYSQLISNEIIITASEKIR